MENLDGINLTEPIDLLYEIISRQITFLEKNPGDGTYSVECINKQLKKLEIEGRNYDDLKQRLKSVSIYVYIEELRKKINHLINFPNSMLFSFESIRESLEKLKNNGNNVDELLDKLLNIAKVDNL